jgi:polar amino acid transport system substrate-binding protein
VSSEFFSSIGYSIDTVTFDNENPRKLMAHRFDYWATGELIGLEIIRQQGLTNSIVPFFVFEHVDGYMACNSSMEQAKVDRWNQILKAMDRDGTRAAITHKY